MTVTHFLGKAQHRCNMKPQIIEPMNEALLNHCSFGTVFGAVRLRSLFILAEIN